MADSSIEKAPAPRMSTVFGHAWYEAIGFCGLFLLSVCGCRSGRPSVSSQSQENANLPTATLAFPDGKSIKVDLASTPAERERGLMYRESLPPDYGMLFVFPRERMYQFWMKNTLVNLDMIFVGRGKEITEVYSSVPRSALDTPEANLARRNGLAQYVLELPEGSASRHGLKTGQKLSFDAPIPEK